MRDYEITIILPGTLEGKDLDKAVAAVSALLSKAGVKIPKTLEPKKQTLAYEIAKNREGSYLYLEAPLAPEDVSDLDKALRINDNVIRHLVVKKETKSKS